MESMVVPYNLSIQNKWYLINELHRIPKITTVIFFQQIIMLHYYVNQTKVRISDFDYHTPIQKNNRHRATEVSEDVPHATPLTEKKLLDMVRTGNLEYHTALAEAGSTLGVGALACCADRFLRSRHCGGYLFLHLRGSDRVSAHAGRDHSNGRLLYHQRADHSHLLALRFPPLAGV